MIPSAVPNNAQAAEHLAHVLTNMIAHHLLTALSEIADELDTTRQYDLIDKFAGYGFNKSHAAAYALLAYQTACWCLVSC